MSLQTAKKLQSSLKANFTSMEKDLASQSGAKISIIKYNNMAKNLERYRESMQKFHQDIYPLLPDAAAEALQDAEYDGLHKRYFQILEDLELLKPEVPTPTPNPVACNNTLKLPKFELPKFSGDIIQWNSFYDLFKASVDSHPGYSGAQKLSVLKSSLGDDASRLISNLQITDSNYSEAMKLLQQRYDNKREIINSHIKRLYTLPVLREENAANLRKVIDCVRESVQALKVLGQPVDNWDSILIFIVSEKLDPESRRQWVLSLTTSDIPKFETFITFLDKRERAFSESGTLKPIKSFTPEKKASSHHTSYSPDTPPTCSVCSESHFTFKCPTLLDNSVSDRLTIIQRRNLCLNCLRIGHQPQSCRSNQTCRRCPAKHHTLLHTEDRKTELKKPEEASSSSSTNTTNSYHMNSSSGVQLHTILPTAIVLLTDQRGLQRPFRALIDSGSELSFITSACVRRLGLPTKRSPLTINGIAGTKVGTADAYSQLHISSRIHDYSTTIDAFILNRVSGRLPSINIDPSRMTHLEGLQLADPFFYKPEEVDLLLGSDVYAELLRSTPVIIGPWGMPSAFDTVFGWVVSGPAQARKNTSVTSHHIRCQFESRQILREVGSSPTLKVSPTLEVVPTFEVSPTLVAAPTFEASPAFEASPTFEAFPTLEVFPTSTLQGPPTSEASTLLVSYTTELLDSPFTTAVEESSHHVGSIHVSSCRQGPTYCGEGHLQNLKPEDQKIQKVDDYHGPVFAEDLRSSSTLFSVLRREELSYSHITRVFCYAFFVYAVWSLFTTHFGVCFENSSDDGRNSVGAGREVQCFHGSSWVPRPLVFTSQVGPFQKVYSRVTCPSDSAHGDPQESMFRSAKGYPKPVTGMTSLELDEPAHCLVRVGCHPGALPLLSSNPGNLFDLTFHHIICGTYSLFLLPLQQRRTKNLNPLKVQCESYPFEQTFKQWPRC